MTISSAERRARASLPVIRFMQAYLPLPVARWLLKQGMACVQLEIYPRMWHVWQINLSLPQAIQSLDDIAQFLKVHLGFDVFENC